MLNHDIVRSDFGHKLSKLLRENGVNRNELGCEQVTLSQDGIIRGTAPQLILLFAHTSKTLREPAYCLLHSFPGERGVLHFAAGSARLGCG